MAVDYNAVSFNVAVGYDMRINYASQINDNEQLENLKKRLENSPPEVQEYYNRIQRAKTDPEYAQEIANSFKELRNEVAKKNKNRSRYSKPITAEQVLYSRDDDNLLMNVMIFNVLMTNTDNSQVETLPEPLQQLHQEFGGFGGGSSGGGGVSGSWDINSGNVTNDERSGMSLLDNMLNNSVQEEGYRDSGVHDIYQDNTPTVIESASTPSYETPSYESPPDTTSYDL